MTDKEDIGEAAVRKLLKENLICWDDIARLYYVPTRKMFLNILKSQGVTPMITARTNYYLREEIEKIGLILREDTDSIKEE